MNAQSRHLGTTSPRGMDAPAASEVPVQHAITVTTSRAVVALSLLVVVLGGLTAGVGLFWQDGTAPETYLSVRGDTVELYGDGIYRYDSIFKGGANKGSDVVTLAIAIPLLLVSTMLYHRGSFRAQLVLLGTMVWFLYASASLALGTAYNGAFLLYIALFSASLFGIVLAFRSVDPTMLASRFLPGLPRRVPGVFMLISGVVTLVSWLQPLIGALLSDEPPALLDHYTTSVTDTLDLGVIVPATIICGLLTLRRDAMGYLLAFSLLVLEALLAPMIALQTVFQLEAGVELTSGEAIGAITGFSTIAVIAIGIIIALLRHITDRPMAPDSAISG